MQKQRILRIRIQINPLNPRRERIHWIHNPFLDFIKETKNPFLDSNFPKKCSLGQPLFVKITLELIRPVNLPLNLGQIATEGFSSFYFSKYSQDIQKKKKICKNLCTGTPLKLYFYMPHETRALMRHENEAGTESSLIFLSSTLNLAF